MPLRRGGSSTPTGKAKADKRAVVSAGAEVFVDDTGIEETADAVGRPSVSVTAESAESMYQKAELDGSADCAEKAVGVGRAVVDEIEERMSATGSDVVETGSDVVETVVGTEDDALLSARATLTSRVGVGVVERVAVGSDMVEETSTGREDEDDNVASATRPESGMTGIGAPVYVAYAEAAGVGGTWFSGMMKTMSTTPEGDAEEDGTDEASASLEAETIEAPPWNSSISATMKPGVEADVDAGRAELEAVAPASTMVEAMRDGVLPGTSANSRTTNAGDEAGVDVGTETRVLEAGVPVLSKGVAREAGSVLACAIETMVEEEAVEAVKVDAEAEKSEAESTSGAVAEGNMASLSSTIKSRETTITRASAKFVDGRK
jgi:hypothetical protein